jgi:7-cyano-7-deazaguanine synthase
MEHLEDRDRTVVLLSGGPDSATLLWHALSEGRRCYPLMFHEGRPESSRQVSAAQRLWERARSLLNSGQFSGSLAALTCIPLASVMAEIGKRIFIHSEAQVAPGGTVLGLSLAATWGYTLQPPAREVLIALHADDAAEGSEFSPNTLQEVEKALRCALDDPEFRIVAPFHNMSKGEVIRMGAQIGVPFSFTWSCINGHELHCGLCGACRARSRAFAIAGVSDPTEYAFPLDAVVLS